jgi:taurine dioxygenase
MEIKLLSGALGAEIKGIDLTDVSDENFKKLMICFLNIKLFFLETSLLPKNNKLLLQKSWDL